MQEGQDGLEFSSYVFYTCQKSLLRPRLQLHVPIGSGRYPLHFSNPTRVTVA